MKKSITLRTFAVAAASALLFTTATQAQVLTDIGATAPTPGANDISQFNTGGGNPAGLNYYWDNGHQNATSSGYTGQSFTTLSNPQGYTLTSLAIKTAGGGGGTVAPTTTQSFTLALYQLSGTGLTNATLLRTFTATSTLAAESDWMQWTGMGVSLAPNTTYAYGFGITPGVTENWELLSTATGWPYTGGQVCEIINAGGKVKYSTTNNTYDATFDLGLSLPAAPIPNPPTVTPAAASLGILAGTSVTLHAAAGGSTPITYLWQTDGGSGGTLTNIPGGAGSNLVVNTTGFGVGTYQYEYEATNSFGSNTSSVIDIVIVPVAMVDIGSTAPTPGSVDISQLLNTSQSDDGLNYYTDNGANHNEWNGQTFTTGSNISGYVLNSLAWKSAGNGNSFPVYQKYDLYIYSLSAGGATASLIASYQCYGGGVENDWFEFEGLNVALTPNTQYAYAFGRDSSATGWEHIANQGGLPYSAGQICEIASAGGTVTYGGAGTSDATFDLGLIVSLAPHASAPAYTPNVTPVYAGTAITLNESAVGGLPLHYQWLTDGGSGGVLTNIPGATSTNLVVDTTSYAAAAFNYEVVVTNSYGATTSSVTPLTVVAGIAPQVVTDISPAPALEGFVGESVSFSASFTGTLPISYQWTLDTGSGPAPISVASNPSAVSNVLVLNNLQTANAGIYAVQAVNSVSGPSTPTTSSSSTLTVLTDPPPPAAGSYGALVLSQNPRAYWRLNEDLDPSTGVLPAYDTSGSNYDALYGQSTQNGYDGIAGPSAPAFPGFETTNTAVYLEAATTNSWLTLPPLNLKTNAVTITMWINPIGNVNASAGLLMNRNGNDAAGLCFGTTVNGSGMAELGYTWNTNNSATWGFNSQLYPLVGVWSFVALVVQTNQATIYLYYLDPSTGMPDLYSAANVIPHGAESFSGGTTWIGDDENALARVFNGDIDEVAVFNYALSSDQILNEFSTGAGLSVLPPSITGQPQSVETYAGNTAKFTATGITGTSPLTYQWQLGGANLNDGGNISGSHTPSLTISNAAMANAGSYQLLVTNPVTVVSSSNATLTVVVPVPGSYESNVLADGPYVFWKLSETNDPSAGGVVAYDYVRGLNGVYQTGAQNGFDGILGPQLPGFPANDTALGTSANVANSFVSASAGALTASNLTYTMWINPSGPVENWAGLLMDRGGAGEGLGFGGSTDGTGMSELGYTWNQNTTWSFDSFIFPPANQWSFVAMVVQPNQGTIYMINSNGVQSAVNAIAHDTEEFGVAWHIGDDASSGTGARTFPGSIADVSVYLSALSSSQVLGLYDTGLQILPPVTIYSAWSGSNMTISWSQGTLLQSTNVLGPWSTNTAPSPYTVAPSNSMMYFKVRVQ